MRGSWRSWMFETGSDAAGRKKILISPYSGATFPVRAFFDDTLLGPATGFFYRDGNQVYLVTNWHVLSGRNANTGQPIDSKGRTTNRIEISFMYSQDGRLFEERLSFKIEIEDSFIWHQHEEGQNIDIGIIKMSRSQTPELFKFKNLIVCINDNNFNDALVQVGTEIVALGFPDGLAKQGSIPIWKRGMIATEFDLFVDGKNIVLIDCLTRQGMSGSPILIYSSTGQIADKFGGVAIHAGAVAHFVGIYSGRYTTSEEHLSLGIVWKHETIREIITNPHNHTYSIKKPAQSL